MAEKDTVANNGAAQQLLSTGEATESRQELKDRRRDLLKLVKKG